MCCRKEGGENIGKHYARGAPKAVAEKDRHRCERVIAITRSRCDIPQQHKHQCTIHLLYSRRHDGNESGLGRNPSRPQEEGNAPDGHCSQEAIQETGARPCLGGLGQLASAGQFRRFITNLDAIEAASIDRDPVKCILFNKSDS